MKDFETIPAADSRSSISTKGPHAGEHTPGPWSVPHFAEPDVNCECKWVLTDSCMGAVAAVYVSGEGDDWKNHGDNPRFAEACANARLIAAAPDMLAFANSIQIYQIEDDDRLWLRVGSNPAVSVPLTSSIASAFLQIEAARCAVVAKATAKP